MTYHLRAVLLVGRRLLIAALVAGGAVASADARSSFPNPAYQVGDSPGDPIDTDLNADGIRDLVVLDNGYGFAGDRRGISALLGRSDGTFSAHLFLATGGRPYRGWADDLNHDGASDMVVGLFDQETFQQYISIFQGHGDGTFGAEQRLVSERSLGASGDFNGDQVKDIVTTTPGPPGERYCQIFFGGGGTFTAAPLFAVQEQSAFSLSVADLNRDGMDDLVAPAGQGRAALLFLLSRGDGTFVTGSFATRGPAYAARAADIDGDGIHDLAVTCLIPDPFKPPTWTLFLHHGAGDGTFASVPSATFTGHQQLLGAEDLDEDARVDLFIDGAVFLARVDGTFGPGLPGPPKLLSPLFADIDRDGRVDLVGSGGESNAVFLFYGNGDGTFGAPPLPVAANKTSSNVTQGDFDGDGDIDLAACDFAGRIDIIPGLDGGAFGPASSFDVPFTPIGIGAVDVNGDARIDLVIAGVPPGSPSLPPPAGVAALYLGGGDGTFEAGGVYPVGYLPGSVKITDVNGDEIADVVVVNAGSSQRDWNLPGGISVLLSRGDGTLSAMPIMTTGEQPSSVAAGDFDRDGLGDLVVANYGDYALGISADVVFLAGNGDGTYHSPSALALGVGFASVDAGDLDEDGILDLVVADTGSYEPLQPGEITVLLGRGNGGFRAAARFPAGLAPYEVVVADLDHDLHLDIAAASNAYFSFFRGAGDGSFGAEIACGLFGPLSLLVDHRFVLEGPTPQIALDLTVTRDSALGHGASVVSWRTSREIDLAGFNILALNPSGAATQLNPVLIPCEECVTDLGHAYSMIVPKHKNAKSIYVEIVHRDGRAERFGPATKF